jgi:hypothetical protein
MRNLKVMKIEKTLNFHFSILHSIRNYFPFAFTTIITV